jgi:hypothetical protein
VCGAGGGSASCLGAAQLRAADLAGDRLRQFLRELDAADPLVRSETVAHVPELMEGVGYKLELPPARHEKLADFRVLVIDTHPLCPTADSIKGSLNGLADRLAKLGCRVLRQSPKLPDLAIWREQCALMANC